MRNPKLILLSCLMTPFVAGSALAQSTETADFKVRITIDESCQIVSADNINFGTHSAQPGQLTAQGNILVHCTSGTDFTVGLSDGGSYTGSSRHMKNTAGAQTIAYTLSWDDQFTADANNTTNVTNGTGSGFAGQPIAIPVHARATLVGNEPAGDYEDTVTATLTY